MKKKVFLWISFCLSFFLWLLDSGKLLVLYLLNKRQKMIVMRSKSEEDGAYQLLHFLRANQISAAERAELIKEIIRKKKDADVFKSELNHVGMKELQENISPRLLDKGLDPYFVKAGERTLASNIQGNVASYARAQFKYVQILMGQLLNHFFNIVFKILVVPFYYLIFFPVAKLTLMFDHKRSK